MIICQECGHRNPDGTTFCRNSECGAFLEWSGQEVDTGALPKVEKPATKRTRFAAALAQTEISVEPGGEGRIAARIGNKGEIVDRFDLEVLGDAAPWASSNPPAVNLLPDTEETAEILFHPPRSPELTTGMKSFQVRVSSAEDPDVSATLEGRIHVGAFHGLSAELVPTNSQARRECSVSVKLANEGNAPLHVALGGRDPDAALGFGVPSSPIEIPPGRQSAAKLKIRAKRSHRTGSPLTHPFEVSAEAEAVPPVRMNGTFVQTALFPRITTGKVIALRVLLTVLGCSLMVLGAFLTWLNDMKGVEVGYQEYLGSAFDVRVDPPSDELDFVTSVAIPALLLSGLALLGVFGKGRLTRFAAGLAVLIYVVFLVTLIGEEAGIGVPVVLAGGVIAFIGGLLGRVSVSQEGG